MYTSPVTLRYPDSLHRADPCEVTLLPPGKFPRFALFAAFLAALVSVYNLEFVRDGFARLLLSNSLDDLMVILAAASSYFVAARSSGYARQIWLLLAIALTIAAAGMGLSVYYQSFVPGSSLAPEPSDIFFFVWVAPLFMILLPRSEDQSSGFDLLRILDFLQIAIVAVTAYLYFFYFTARWQSEQFDLVRGILIVYIVRDLILSAAFFLRSRSSMPLWVRRFSLALAAVFLGTVISHADYFVTFAAGSGGASWGDFLWMLPYALIAVVAAFWNPAQAADFPAATSRTEILFTTQFFPLVMPLLVIFMARAIAPQHSLLAWLALGASVFCSSIRLILTNRRQKRTSANLLAAERALLSSQQLLTHAYYNSPDGFTINSIPNGKYIEVNEGFTRLTGYTREESVGRSPVDMNLWVNPGTRQQFLADLVEKGMIRNFEIQFRTKAGQFRDGLLSGSLVTLGGVQHAVVSVRDITEMKAAQEALLQSEERFRAFVENLHVGIVSCDHEGHIIYANPAVLRMFEYRLEDVVGKTEIDLNYEVLREDGSVIPPAEGLIPTVIAARQPLTNLVIGWRRVHTHKTVWTLLDVVPQCDASGEVSCILLSLTDLTEQRHATDALRESEERFRTLVRDLHVGVVLHNPDATIQFANRAALDLFGLELPDVLNRQPVTLGFEPVDLNGRPIAYEKLPAPTVLRTKLPVRNIVMGWRRPGSNDILWIFGNAVPQFAADGSILRVITSFSDITEMKNAERSIHQLSTELLKLQDDERRRIGRELHDGMAQTVLAVNLSLAQIRQSGQPLSDASKRALDKARELLQQMSREIRTLSYLLHPPLLDDLGLVTALKEYVNGFGERCGIETSLELPPHFRRLPQMAETALFRITQESLSNIQRHSGSKRAKVSLREDAESVVLEVTDFGHGMASPENGEFSRPPRLGVGIPGMRERMSQLGGYLDIESDSHGTTVRARILLSAPALKDVLHESPASSYRG